MNFVAMVNNGAYRIIVTIELIAIFDEDFDILNEVTLEVRLYGQQVGLDLGRCGIQSLPGVPQCVTSFSFLSYHG